MKHLLKVLYAGTPMRDSTGALFREIAFETYFEEEPKHQVPILKAVSNYWQDSKNPLIPGNIYDTQEGDIWVGKIVSQTFDGGTYYGEPISLTYSLPVIGDTEDVETFRAITLAVFSKKAKGLKRQSSDTLSNLTPNSPKQDTDSTEDKPKNPPMIPWGNIFDEDDD